MYSKIDALFWSDEKTRAMSPDARYIVLYLLTTPHRNILGCYHLPKLYIMADTKLSQSKFNTAWKEVLKSGMVKYDEASEMILVCNFIKYNPLENPNQVKGAISKLKEMPITPFFADIAESLSKEKSKADLSELIMALYERSGMDEQTLSERVSPTVTERVSERVTETVTESVPKQRNSNSISNSNYIHEDDDSVYNNAHAHAHTHEAEEPYENITDYLNLSDTAYAMVTDLETEQVEEYIRKSWKYHTGKSPNAANVGDIEACARLNDMEVATISEAISLAARNASGSITGYACQCLRDWASRGLHTLNEVYRAEISVNGGST